MSELLLPGDITPRQSEVLGHTVRGKTEKEIALEMKISRHTVHQHERDLRRKLGARNRAQLVAIAMGNGVRSVASQSDQEGQPCN